MSICVNFKGTEYPLATTLRVAYKVQGQHDHKSYAAVFEGIGEMLLEDQIGILYAAFECANPDDARKITRTIFQDAYLDTYNMSDMMEQLQQVISGIMGKDIIPAEPTSDSEVLAGTEGN